MPAQLGLKGGTMSIFDYSFSTASFNDFSSPVANDAAYALLGIGDETTLSPGQFGSWDDPLSVTVMGASVVTIAPPRSELAASALGLNFDSFSEQYSVPGSGWATRYTPSPGSKELEVYYLNLNASTDLSIDGNHIGTIGPNQYGVLRLQSEDTVEVDAYVSQTAGSRFSFATSAARIVVIPEPEAVITMVVLAVMIFMWRPHVHRATS